MRPEAECQVVVLLEVMLLAILGNYAALKIQQRFKLSSKIMVCVCVCVCSERWFRVGFRV